MFALVRVDGAVGWSDLPSPELGLNDVRIRPRLVGICRTDLAVASGRLPVGASRVLGHEVVGEVTEVGDEVRNCQKGDKVGVDPTIACGACRQCSDGWPHACKDRRFMGLDCDGAIAESFVIPSRSVWAMPPQTEDARVAMLEPVAACSAVMKVPFDPDDRGLINGSGRLAVLTQRILKASGASAIQSEHDVEPGDVEPFDFVIDTEGTSESIASLLTRLRPGGTLVLKSRPVGNVSMSFREILPKEPMIYVVNYGSFREARRLLVDGNLDLDGLLGPVWSASDYANAFAAAARDEERKHFLSLQFDASTRQAIHAQCEQARGIAV